MQNNADLSRGGVQACLDTKELRKAFSKEKDRSNKSNFLENSFEKENILNKSTESICNKTKESRVVTIFQIKNTFALGKAAIPNMAYTRIIKHFSVGIIQKYT